MRALMLQRGDESSGHVQNIGVGGEVAAAGGASGDAADQRGDGVDYVF
jgi:hypothetical protein